MWSKAKIGVLKKILDLRELKVLRNLKNIRTMIPLKKVSVVMLNSKTNEIMKFYRFLNNLKKKLRKSDIWL